MSVLRFSPVTPPQVRERSNGVREWRRQYLGVLSDNRNAREQFLRNRPDLRRWQPHPEDRDCLVQTFDAVPRKHSLIYDITVDWSNEFEEPDDPLSKPVDIELATSEQQIPVVRTVSGEYLTTTAGQLIEGETETINLITFSISKNVGSYPQWLADDYERATNRDHVIIKGIACPPRTLKISRLRIGAEQEQEDTKFAPLSMEVIRNKLTWDRFLLNRGTEEIVLRKWTHPKTKKTRFIRVRESIKNDVSEYITEPVFLDADGRRPRVDPDTLKPITLAQELKALKAGTPLKTIVKEPLDKDDIIILRKETLIPMPFGTLGLF